MVEDDKVALRMPDQISPSQTSSPSPALFTLSQVCPFFFSIYTSSVLDFCFLYFLQLMAAIPRADIYFRINEKLSSLGSLQYSKYVPKVKLS
jgi:CCR4-NOT transcription complex subunit 1